LIRDPLGEFEPQALVSTNLEHTAIQILSWFVRRWRMEVTFEESRAHVGIESQRQWSDLAIARTTPVLFGLYSMVTLMADQLIESETNPVRAAAWYNKQTPTFSDAIAIVRRCLWKNCGSLGIAGNAPRCCGLGAWLKLWQAEVEQNLF